jgi:hypothetical protein
MKKPMVLSVLVMLAIPAFAGKSFEGYACINECPLAKQANTHRSYGTEAITVSTAMRTDLATNVEKNLLRI